MKAAAKERKKRRKPLTVEESKERKRAKQTKQTKKTKKSNDAHCVSNNEVSFPPVFFEREERMDALFDEEMRKFARDYMEHSEWVQRRGTSIVHRLYPAHFPGDDE